MSLLSVRERPHGHVERKTASMERKQKSKLSLTIKLPQKAKVRRKPRNAPYLPSRNIHVLPMLLKRHDLPMLLKRLALVLAA